MAAGSDLVFEEHHAALLAPLLARLLDASPRAGILLAHAHRNPELDDRMTEAFAQCGLRISEAVRTGEDTAEQDISVVTISRM